MNTHMSVNAARIKLNRAVRAVGRATVQRSLVAGNRTSDDADSRRKLNRKLELLEAAIDEHEQAILRQARSDFFHDVLGVSGLGFDEQTATLYKHENNTINLGRTPLLAFFLAVRKFAGFSINTLLYTMHDRSSATGFIFQTPSDRAVHRVLASIVSAAGGKVVVDQNTLITCDSLRLSSTENSMDGSVTWEIQQ
jgi:hypothetical protein